MIDQNVDQQGWFKVIEHVSDLHKHTANPGNKYYLSLITEAKVEIGDIILLTEFYFNEKVLYQESSTIFPDRGGS